MAEFTCQICGAVVAHTTDASPTHCLACEVIAEQAEVLLGALDEIKVKEKVWKDLLQSDWVQETLDDSL